MTYIPAERIIEENEYFVLYISDPVEGVAREKHYAVFNKEFGVVEHRSPVFLQANGFFRDVTTAYADMRGEDDDPQILTLNGGKGEIITH